MQNTSHGEALATISDAVGEDHAGLVRFTDKLNAIEDVPTFWWRDQPVWVRHHANTTLTSWPLRTRGPNQILIARTDGQADYAVNETALHQILSREVPRKLSDAEFRLFLDLSAGRSIEDSAARAHVAIGTRRKQLQNCFRKLDVKSQAELVSLANRIVARLLAEFSDIESKQTDDWSSYLKYAPQGARCGVIAGPDTRPVRYMELGPVDGKPVLVLHPMIFPHLDAADVALCQTLGLRLIWPIRPGCLSTTGHATRKWTDHCQLVVEDLQAIRAMHAGSPMPVIALVSSAAYAVAFAQQTPDAVDRIDFVSTCFSAGKQPSKDVYFGDFILRKFQQNARMAAVAIQHIADAALQKNRFERTMRRVFRGSPPDQAVLDADFKDPVRRERLNFAVRHSIHAMRLDYMAQLHFNWDTARSLTMPLQFWHGAADTVHALNDLNRLAVQVSGKDTNVMPDMGHLTQDAPLRDVISRIAETYPD